MHIRYLLAASPGNLFAASDLAIEEQDEVPGPGDAFEHEAKSYRVVKVLPDVDPEYGTNLRGPVVYVVLTDSEEGISLAPITGKAPLSFLINTANALRDCIERADAARRTGNSEQYRRHVEEFLFLSNTAARLIGPRSAPKPIPFVGVYSENDGVSSLLREGLIEASFAAHVEPVRSLTALTYILDRMDPVRPSLFIITEPITHNLGAAAIRTIREHPAVSDWPILVLAQQNHVTIEKRSRSIGATGCAEFPAKIDEFAALVGEIRAMVRVSTESRRPGRRQGTERPV